MCKLYVRSVGHGACMAIDAPCINSKVHVDCGSIESAPWAAEQYLWLGSMIGNADAFFLTHFHYDHYNGLVWLAEQNRSSYSVEAAYYPRIPNVIGNSTLRDRLMECIIAFTLYKAAQPSRLLLGDNNSFVQRHFAEVIRQVNKCPSGCVGVSQNDIVRTNNEKWKILWPPREVDECSPYSQVMNDGLEAFEAAVEVDEKLKKAFNITKKECLAEQYNLTVECDDHHLIDNCERCYEVDEVDSQEEIECHRPDDENQSPAVRDVNKALRKVADIFSLAFLYEDHVLFLGDLKSREISEVVSMCSKNSNTKYNILVSSHHGTRWNKSLQTLTINNAVVSSVGGKLINSVRPEYGEFSGRHYLTCNDGHLKLPI